MKFKISTLIIISIFLSTISTSTLDFRTENPINFYSSQDLNSNDITGLNTQIFNNTGDQFIRVYGNNPQPHTLQYEDRDLRLQTPSSSTLILRDDSDVGIPNGNLDLSGNRLENLGSPVDSDDAVRLQYVAGNFVNRSGDTMSGNLDFDGNNVILRGGYITNDGGGEGLKIGNNGDVLIPSEDLNLSTGREINLGQGAKIRQQNNGRVEITTGGSGSDNVSIIDETDGGSIITAQEGGTVNIPNGDIKISGNTDGIDIDNPGNAISKDGNQYVISSGDIGSDEIGSNAITSSGGELDTSVAGNQLELNSGSIEVLEGSNSDLDADLLDGVQLSNIDWGDVAMDETDVSPSQVGLSTLSTGDGLSGSGYDGTSAVTWTVDWTAAGDLGTGGDISDNSVENAELANSQITIEGNTVSLGNSVSVNHNDLSSISYNDHHGLGDDLNWDASNNPRLSNTIDVNNVDVSNSFKFPVGNDAY